MVQKRLIQRLYPAHIVVCKGRCLGMEVYLLSDLIGYSTYREYSIARTFSKEYPLLLYFLKRQLPHGQLSITTRITYGQSLFLLGKLCCIEHIAQFYLIAWGYNFYIRDTAQVSYIEHSLMSRSILPYQTCSIDTENHLKLLQSYIMNELVVPPLQESRINHQERQQALSSQTSSKGHGMLFGYAHIESAGRELLLHIVKGTTSNHSRSDPHYRLVLSS